MTRSYKLYFYICGSTDGCKSHYTIKQTVGGCIRIIF